MVYSVLLMYGTTSSEFRKKRSNTGQSIKSSTQIIFCGLSLSEQGCPLLHFKVIGSGRSEFYKEYTNLSPQIHFPFSCDYETGGCEGIFIHFGSSVG